MSDVMTNVHLKGARGITIVGNTFWQGFTHNLLVEDCSQVVVGPNMFERNPMYNYTREADNAIVFQDSRDCTLQGLHVHNVQSKEAGVVLRNCQRMNVTGCTVLDCLEAGMLLDNVRASRVSDCLIRDDREEGAPSVPLKVTGGSQNVLTDNTFNAEPKIGGKGHVVKDNVVVGE